MTSKSKQLVRVAEFYFEKAILNTLSEAKPKDLFQIEQNQCIGAAEISREADIYREKDAGLNDAITQGILNKLLSQKKVSRCTQTNGLGGWQLTDKGREYAKSHDIPPESIHIHIYDPDQRAINLQILRSAQQNISEIKPLNNTPEYQNALNKFDTIFAGLITDLEKNDIKDQHKAHQRAAQRAAEYLQAILDIDFVKDIGQSSIRFALIAGANMYFTPASLPFIIPPLAIILFGGEKVDKARESITAIIQQMLNRRNKN